MDATVTCGHAFGGDYEAVSVYSALAVARHVIHADAAVVVMGPGIVGTGTRLGFTGIEVGPVLDAATGLQGDPIACLRVSFADDRPRHQGVSHHTLTTLRLACRSRVTIPIPTVGGAQEARIRADLDEAGIADRHDLVDVAPVGIAAAVLGSRAAHRVDGPPGRRRPGAVRGRGGGRGARGQPRLTHRSLVGSSDPWSTPPIAGNGC